MKLSLAYCKAETGIEIAADSRNRPPTCSLSTTYIRFCGANQANSRVFGLIRSNFLPDSFPDNSGRCTLYWLPWSRREMCQSTLSRITARRCRRASSSSSDGSSILLPADPIGFVFTGIPTMRFSGLMVGEAFLPISGSITSPVPRLSLSVPAKCIGGTKSRASPDR